MTVAPIPPDYPRVTPYLSVDGAADAIDFYVSALGATQRGDRMTMPDGRIGHAELMLDLARQRAGAGQHFGLVVGVRHQGAGFALALSADMIIASPRAKFAMAHLRLGLVPDLGALYLLPRVVGLQRAKELVFSTRDVSADEARELGIVMEVHASEALEARARDMAERMARAAPTAVALSKAMLNASLDSDRQSAFALEAASQAAAFAAPEPAAQVEAILGKQRPAFSGLKYARG